MLCIYTSFCRSHSGLFLLFFNKLFRVDLLRFDKSCKSRSVKCKTIVWALKQSEREKIEGREELLMDIVMSDSDEESEGSLFSIDLEKEEKEDSVYVVASKEALAWTLKHAIAPSSTVLHLIHVFPLIHLVPSPCNLFFSSFIWFVRLYWWSVYNFSTTLYDYF